MKGLVELVLDDRLREGVEPMLLLNHAVLTADGWDQASSRWDMYTEGLDRVLRDVGTRVREIYVSHG